MSDITAVTGQTSAADGATALAGIKTAFTNLNTDLIPATLASGYTTIVTAAGNTILTVSSTYKQFFTGITTQTVTLPVTSTLALGQSFLIKNDSTGLVTVNSSGGNAVIVLADGTSTIVHCTLLTGTTAASWEPIYHGAIVATGKKLNVSNSITVAGTDGTTITLPTTNATLARTDAGNTFTGHQTMEGVTATGATGTGKHVYDTSPVLVTPAIGAATGTSLVVSSKVDEAKGADIASATTTDIGGATGNYINITGTTTITGLGTVQAGTRRIVNFNDALTLTYNATSLILPTSANILTIAGDTATFVSLGSGNWVCIQYQRKNGAALYAAGGSTPTCVSIAPRPVMPTSGAATVTTAPSTTVAPIGAFVLPFGITINKLSINTNGAVTSTVNVAVYSEDGQTRELYVTNQTLNTISPTIGTISISAVALAAGVHYIAISNPTGSASLKAWTPVTTDGANTNNGVGSEPIYEGTLAITASALPSTFNPVSDITVAAGNTLIFRLDN